MSNLQFPFLDFMLTKEKSAQVQLFLPFSDTRIENLISDDSFRSWKSCISIVEDMADAFRFWRPEYFAVADPMISSIIWFTGCMLTLHMMSTGSHMEEFSNIKVANALDLLNLALENFASYWKISLLLLGNFLAKTTIYDADQGRLTEKLTDLVLVENRLPTYLLRFVATAHSCGSVEARTRVY